MLSDNNKQEIDWLIEQCLTSTPSMYRLSGRQFYRSKDPTNSIKVLKEKHCKGKTRKSKQHKIQQHNKETHIKNTASPLHVWVFAWTQHQEITGQLITDKAGNWMKVQKTNTFSQVTMLTEKKILINKTNSKHNTN